jgi:hypothetical protein
MRPNYRFLLLLILALCTPAILYFGGWLPFIYPHFIDPLYTAQTTGTIVAAVKQTRSKTSQQNGYYFTIEFHTPDGRVHSFTEDTISHFPGLVGQNVAVKYSSRHPWFAQPTSFNGKFSLLMGLSEGGILLAMVVAFMVFYSFCSSYFTKKR